MEAEGLNFLQELSASKEESYQCEDGHMLTLGLGSPNNINSFLKCIRPFHT